MSKTEKQKIKLNKVDDKTAYVNLLVKYAELEQKLEQTEKDLADYQFNYPKINENEGLKEELKEWKDEWQEQVQKATDEGWERTKLTGRVRELEQLIGKLKADLDNARESANRQEQWELYSVLNDLYNENFEITKGVSN